MITRWALLAVCVLLSCGNKYTAVMGVTLFMIVAVWEIMS